MKAQILGNDIQLVDIMLAPGESLQAEPGSLIAMDHGIDMKMSSGGGILRGISRMIGGEDFFVTNFTNNNAIEARVVFGVPYPGQIHRIELGRDNPEFFCQRGSFLCSSPEIQASVALTKRIGGGLFGGEGFVLQKLTGTGDAFIHAGGTLVHHELVAGQILHVSTGCVVGYTSTVDMSIKMVKGVMSMLFSGEGLWMTTLTGPGHVLLQTMPFSSFVEQITARLPDRKK